MWKIAGIFLVAGLVAGCGGGGGGDTTANTNPTPAQPLAAKAMVSTSSDHTLALANDGSVWAWGHNLAGQLGDGTQVDRATPIRINSLSGVVAVSAGSFWSMALRADGTVWAWGSNFQSKLGFQGDDQYLPRQIHSLASIRSVSAGASHGLALRSDGTVLSWGGNSCGQLGVPPSTTLNDFRSSIQAVAGVSGAVQIVAGNGRSLARLSDGTVMAWGCESTASGLTIQSVPRAVTGLSGTDWITTGGNSSSSVKSDGTLVSWGYDSSGHFGLNSFATSYVTTPVTVPNLSGVARSAINDETSLALTTDGSVFSAGKGYYGELGDSRYGSFGFNSARSTFAQISALSRVVQVALGDGHAVALDADGSVWTWGRNDVGQLGRVASGQTTGDGRAVSAMPSKIDGLSLGATTLAVGGNEGGTSGGNAFVIQVAAGLQHTLALGTGGRYWAWGRNTYGEIGDGSATNRPSPVRVAIENVAALEAGNSASMALKTDGTVMSWGYNGDGWLGDGSTTNRLVPGPVSGLSGIRKLSFKYGHALALAGDGTVWAWGSNHEGQLGDGSFASRSVPIRVASLAGGSPVVNVVAGVNHSMALRSDGTVWAWGSNAAGKLGNAANVQSLTAQAVVQLSNIDAIAAGHDHSLALRNDGTVWVWGDGMLGQFGTGNRSQSSTPAQVPGLSDIRAIAAGRFFSLALKGNGTVWVWGQWGETQALLSEHLTPARLGTLEGVRSISASSDHAVMTNTDGAVWVWGSNSNGQLGLNGVSFASVPMRLSLP